MSKNYIEYDPSEKMELEVGEYMARVASIRRPTGNEEYIAPDLGFVWRVTKGIYAGMEIKQNFRHEQGDEEQRGRSKQKLLKTLAALNLPANPTDSDIVGKEAQIKVSSFQTDDKEGVYVSSVVDHTKPKAEKKPKAIINSDVGETSELNDQIPF
jgi:hypothetical protein